MTQDRYRIVRTIGRGGMGEVCLADDLVLRRQLALKFISASDDQEAVEQLLTEARAAAALDHPFICAIYEVTTLDGRPCIAMEYVRGETLERRLRRGPLPVGDALRIAEEIAEALEAAHNRRIIHRDLKPANVMLTEAQHIKVMDFGIAARLTGGDHPEEEPRRHEPDMIRGTPAYMAPEQIRGEPADRRSDIFAFGILLYHTLAGVNPFSRGGIDATLAAILQEAAPDLHVQFPSVPAAVGAAVARMLAKDPGARQQSFAEVRRNLRAAASAVSIPGSVVSPVVDPAPSTTSASVVGRDAERAQLRQAIAQAVAGTGRLVVLSGEPGIGKSKLAEDALEGARRAGVQTIVGRCYEQDGAPPLISVIEVLEGASRLMPAVAFQQAIGPLAPELVKLLPELRRLFPNMTPPLELPPQLRQRFLFSNISDFLARASRFAPMALLLDDLQWADESTLQLLEYLAPRLETMPVVLMAACRDVDSPVANARGALQNLFERVRGQSRDSSTPSASATLSRLVTQSHARAIVLRPLTDTETALILSALAQQDVPPAIARRFVEHTGGNPHFLTELFRHLNEQNRLFDTGGRWKLYVDFADAGVPESVRAVVERRIQRVSPDTQTVLKTAALFGRQFELDLLEAASDMDEDTLLSALEQAESARLVKGPSGRQDVMWRFTHQLIADALIDSIPTVRRQRMHLRAATAFERFHTRARPYTSEIAHHLYAAGRLADPERTAAALTIAGDAAYAMYATHDAIRHYRRALEVADEAGADEEKRLRIHEHLADLLALSGENAAAIEQYRQIDAVHRQREAHVDRGRIARKVGTLYWQSGDRGEAMACYTRALQALDGRDAGVEAAHLYHELGLAAFRRGDNQQAIEWSERSLAAADSALAAGAGPGVAARAGREETAVRKEATRAIANATNTIGVALARLGRLEEARDRIERSVATARDVGLLDVACRAYANLGVLYGTLEPKRAIDVSLQGLELASRIGAASMQSYIYANLAAAYCALTDRCEAEGLDAARTAASLDRQLGQLDHLAVPLIVIAQIHQCRGELDEAHRHYMEALALAEQTAEPQLILPCYDGLATISLDRGDHGRAEEFMQRSRALCERTGLDPDTLLLLPFLS